MLLLDRCWRDFIDSLSVSQRFYLLGLDIRDSELYVAFSIDALGFVLLRHYALSLRSCDSCVAAPLAWVRRSLVKHVSL